MIVLTGSQFRANQSKYVGVARSGEDVIVKSRAGNYRVVPINNDKYIPGKDELLDSLYMSMRQAKLAKEGNAQLHSWEDLMDELEG